MVARNTWKSYERRLGLLLWGLGRNPLSGINSDTRYGDCKGSPWTIEAKKWTHPPSLNEIYTQILPKILAEAARESKPGIVVIALPKMKDEDSLVFTDLKTFKKLFTEYNSQILEAIATHEQRLKEYNDSRKKAYSKKEQL